MRIITIGIPTYNRRDIVYENVIHTLTNLDYNDFEIVVVDNGSEDGTFEKLKEIDDSRLKVFTNGKNLGVTRNFYKVIEYAQSKWVFMLSDEDFLEINAFKNLLYELKHNSTLFDRIGYIKVNNTKSKNKIFGNFNYGKILYKILLNNNYMSGNIYNKDFLKQVDYLDYKTIYPHMQITLKLSQVSEVLFIKEALYDLTKKGKNYISENYIHPLERLKLLEERINLLKSLKNIDNIEIFEIFIELYDFSIFSVYTYSLYLKSNYYKEYYKLKQNNYTLFEAKNYLKKYIFYFIDVSQSLNIENYKYIKSICIKYYKIILRILKVRDKFDEFILKGYTVYSLDNSNKNIFDEFNLKVNLLDKEVFELNDKEVLIIEKEKFNEIKKINKCVRLLEKDILLSGMHNMLNKINM